MGNSVKAENKNVFEADPGKVKLYRSIENNISITRSFCLFREPIEDEDVGTIFDSRGIHDLWVADPEFFFIRASLVRRFFSGDIGAEDEWDSKQGRQYSMDHKKFLGCYRTEYGPVEVKREGWYSVMYLPFER